MRFRGLVFRLVTVSAVVLTRAAHGQVNTGELRLKVVDAAGLGLGASVSVSNEVVGYRSALATGADGEAEVQGLPFGMYRVYAERQGFSPAAELVEVRSALPVVRSIRLSIAPVANAVTVETVPLVDPYSPSSVVRMGAGEIRDRLSSLPGRTVQDLVSEQPGWIYEGNAVLHPRGSEYQTQVVLDGMPLLDNRSPGFGPEIEADDLESVSVYTAGITAEYGRKMGGIVELNTRRAAEEGTHGQVVLSGGSYGTGTASGRVQQVARRNTFGVSGSGGMSAHYLNPVVPENYSNRGTTGDFAGRYERELTGSDRLALDVRHELSRFEVPNERVQQQAGQLQTGDNFETLGTVRYQRIFSPERLAVVTGMVRDRSSDLHSNDASTPILAFQHNRFREGYLKATYSQHVGSHELKAGVESDNVVLHENFSYRVTDPTQFDDGTPASLSFAAARPNLEQSAFAEDLFHKGNWTVSAGLRWDHYQLLVNENAVSPRLSMGWYLPGLNTVLHASYDRVFQTPSSENILISSSTSIEALSSQFLRLPVRPSRGNYYEAGLTKALRDRVSLAANVYRRDVGNYADDDQLLNTGVSYPIAFDHAAIYGAEAKLALVGMGRMTGFASYSYMVGRVWLPVTGGLFLGDAAGAAVVGGAGHFPDSQDQRNTLRTRFRYQVRKRVWLASGASYGSGLPFAYTGTYDDALAQYGPKMLSRINFARGRIRPSLALSASLGADVYKSEAVAVRFQADGDNLNGRLNVLDFGGLFSGNAIAPGRSFGLRLNTSF